jgi:hypothetical protein
VGTSLRHRADFRFAYAMSMPTARGLRAKPSGASDGAAAPVQVYRHECRRGGGFGWRNVDLDTRPPHPHHRPGDRMTSSPVPPAPVGCLPVPGGGQKFGAAAMRVERGVDAARYRLSLRTAEHMQRCFLASLHVIGRIRKEYDRAGLLGSAVVLTSPLRQRRRQGVCRMSGWCYGSPLSRSRAERLGKASGVPFAVQM